MRLAATALLGVSQREIGGTARIRFFGHPEIVLYDTVPGGAGYCHILIARHSMRALLAPHLTPSTVPRIAATPAALASKATTIKCTGSS